MHSPIKRNVIQHKVNSKTLKPGLVASYDIWLGTGEGLFWFWCFINPFSRWISVSQFPLGPLAVPEENLWWYMGISGTHLLWAGCPGPAAQATASKNWNIQLEALDSAYLRQGTCYQCRNTDPWSGSSPKFNHLFTGPLPTFPENFMQIRLQVLAQSC